MLIYKKPGEGEYPAVAESGNELLIGEYSVNLDNKRRDSENIVDIKENQTFIANLVIPPNTYTEVDSGEVDEDGSTIINKVLDPINKGRIKVILWPQNIYNNNNEIEE